MFITFCRLGSEGVHPWRVHGLFRRLGFVDWENPIWHLSRFPIEASPMAVEASPMAVEASPTAVEAFPKSQIKSWLWSQAT